MQSQRQLLGELIRGMRRAFDKGENAMAYARARLAESGGQGNALAATLVAYDLQSGSYVAQARAAPEAKDRWGRQLAGILDPHLPSEASLLEVGCGEATTLASVLTHLARLCPRRTLTPLGFDVSWSRIKVANEWLDEVGRSARLFVADLFHMPLADATVDVVYTSHSVEPNGGREREAIAELLRVARTHVVLVEPCYELATAEARSRMDSHGYVKGLRAAAESLGAEVLECRLLDEVANPLNPSGVIVLRKPGSGAAPGLGQRMPAFACPLSGAALESLGDVWWTPELGLAYPVIRGIPLLAPEHAFVASRLSPR